MPTLLEDSWEQRLAGAGLRATPARLLVVRYLSQRGHSTPEEIHAHADRHLPGVGLSTIYRTLDTLVEHQLADWSDPESSSRVYHLTEHADHMHLICRDCGAVDQVDLSWARELSSKLAAASGFQLDQRHLGLVGRCARCRAVSP